MYGRYGGPDVLSVAEVERPTAGPEQVLVRVEAVEATKTDAEMRSFRQAIKWTWLPMRLMLGVFRPRRPILGMYFAGAIESDGAEVDGFAVGDAVFGSTGLGRGAYGEFVALPATAAIAPKPSTMTFAEAAAVPLGATNALHFLRLAEVRPGERVLVNGAGGVIGGYGVQTAAMMGADVTGVDAGHKEAFVRSSGASRFVDYQVDDITALGERFDVILDMVPRHRLGPMLDLLQPGGRYAHGNPRLSTLLRARFTSRRSGKRVIVTMAAETPAVFAELAELVDAGEIGPIVDRVLPIDEAAEAHRLVDSEERLGAIVLAVGERANQR